LPDAALVIQGERILAVGRREELLLPAEVQAIELRWSHHPAGPDQCARAQCVRHEQPAPLGPGRSDHRARPGRTAGPPLLPHPRQVACRSAERLADLRRTLVTVPKGYPIVGNNFPSLTVTGPDDARQKIERLIDDGADLVKITLTSGGAPSLSAAEPVAIVETAHERGVPVSAHATTSRDLQRALDAGVDDVDHLATDRRLRQPNRADGRLRGLLGAHAAGIGWTGARICNVLWPRAPRRAGQRRWLSGWARGWHAHGRDPRHARRWDDTEPDHRRRDEGMRRTCAGQDATRAHWRQASFADVLVVTGDPLQDLEALARVRMVIHRGAIIRDERRLD